MPSTLYGTTFDDGWTRPTPGGIMPASGTIYGKTYPYGTYGQFLPDSIPGLVLWLRADLGITAVMSAVVAAGTAPPAVTLTGVPSPLLPVEIDITGTGALGVPFTWKLGGVVQATGLVTAANVPLGSGTLAAQFTIGAYTNDNVYTATVNVSAWADQSNQTASFVQATSANQPSFTVSGINGVPSLSFAAASASSIATTTLGTTIMPGPAAERFMVFQGTTDAPSSIFTDNGGWGNSGSVDNIPFSDGNIYDGFGRTTRPGFVKGTSFSVANIYSSESSGTGGTGLWQARYNGAIIAASVSNTNTFAARGAAPSLASSTVGFQLSEFIVFNRPTTLSTAERNTMLTYLHNRYGIAVTLS
jgi:hypothetical protein